MKSCGQFRFATVVALKEALYFVNLLLATCISPGYLLLAPFSEKNKSLKLAYLLSPASVVMASLVSGGMEVCLNFFKSFLPRQPCRVTQCLDCTCDWLLWSWNDVSLVGRGLLAVRSVARRCPYGVDIGCVRSESMSELGIQFRH